MRGNAELEMKLKDSRRALPLNELILELLDQERFKTGIRSQEELREAAWAKLVSKPTNHPSAAHMDLHNAFTQSLGTPVSEWRNFSWNDIKKVHEGKQTENRYLNRITNEFDTVFSRTITELIRKKRIKPLRKNTFVVTTYHGENEFR